MGDGPPSSLDAASLWSAIESAAEVAHIGIYVAQVDGEATRILYVNSCAAEIVGRPAAELIGRTPWSLILGEEIPVVRTSMDRPFGSPPARLELTVVRPDGKHVPVTLPATRAAIRRRRVAAA